VLRQVIIACVLFLIACAEPIRNPVNLTLLIDCSSSMSEGRVSTERDIVEAGKWWAGQAMKNGGGRLEIIVIGRGIDDVSLVVWARCPSSFAPPIYESKKKWMTGLERQLDSLAHGLPADAGSAIIEGILRASNRLNENRGEKNLVIYSDLRQVSKALNFESSVPCSLALVEELVKRQHLTPDLRNIKVVVAGFKPYPPNPKTSRISPADFGKLRIVWFSLFEKWGAKVKLCESLTLQNL
jgi:hypothetical protein